MNHTRFNSSSHVVVVGQGYVGLPLAIACVNAGFLVTGLDLNQQVVRDLNAGISHVDDITDVTIGDALGNGYRASRDFSTVTDADVVVICVPTPLDDSGTPDTSAIHASIEEVAPRIKKSTLIVLESTTYPGTTDHVLLPLLEASGKVIDRDFYLAFSPERIDPGNLKYTLKNTPKVVGGVTPASTQRAVAFYNRFIDSIVTVSGAKEAEMAKLLENTYRHVNIALVNEMVRFCKELGIDLWEVIRAAATKPFGFQAFYPGPGVGGHCIPIDPNYLGFEVKRQLGYPFRFVELAQEINESMPRYVVDRLQDVLNDASKPLRGSNVLLLGVTYKMNIADQRESPARPIANLLLSKGAIVSFHDPWVKRWHLSEQTLECSENLDEAVSKSDLVVLLQAHEEYEIEHLCSSSVLFFDTRGVSRGKQAVRL